MVEPGHWYQTSVSQNGCTKV